MATYQDVLSLDALRLQLLALYRYRRGLMFEIGLAKLAKDKTELARLAYLWRKTNTHIQVLNRWIRVDSAGRFVV